MLQLVIKKGNIIMNIKKHLILAAVAVLAWAAFYLIGLSSDYFLNWSTAEKILITWMGFFSILPLICFLLVVFLGGDYFKTSLWVAFYASVGPFILDCLVVGLIKGKGISFLISHWYLTIGYLEALVVMPLVGFALKKLKGSYSSSDTV
jgi:hypothetical protein